MPIIYRQADLFDAPEYVIAHGCNARGVMGSGVAKQVVERFPDAYAAYRVQHKTYGLKLGEVISAVCYDARIKANRVIANCITQQDYGREPGRRYVDYDAVRQCFRTLNDMVRNDLESVTAIAMPLIGAGLAQGDWKIIASIIEEEATNYQPVVYVPDGRIP